MATSSLIWLLFLSGGHAEESGIRPNPDLISVDLVLISRVAAALTGLVGGMLAGVCFLILCWQRQKTGIGLLALFLSAILGTAFGTIATLLPGVVLLFYFLRKNTPPPIAEVESPRWWVSLFWVLLLGSLYLGLQVAASIPAFVPYMLGPQPVDLSEVSLTMMQTGETFLFVTNAAWISLLVLLVVCGTNSREHWNEKLGIFPWKLRQGAVWFFGALAILVLLGLIGEQFLDEKSREAIKLISFGVYTPVIFVFALVIAAPVVEELIFRGYAYWAWVKKFGVIGTAFLSSCIFALLHFQYGFSGILFLFIFGLVLTTVRWKTGSIYPCILLHFLNNLANCLMAFWKHAG